MVEVGALYDTERADAWGYSWGANGHSVLVEVKVSRSDFLRDKHKPHRQPGTPSLGDFRYFMCPAGLLTLDDMPEGWGLLWVNARGHVQVMAGHVAVMLSENYRPSRILIDLWRHTVDRHKECSLVAYLLGRVGDPDAVLQQNRQALREKAYAEQKVQQLEKEAKENRRYMRRLERRLETAGLETPTAIARTIL